VDVGPDVEVLASVVRPLPYPGAGLDGPPALPSASPVLLRQGRILAASFHPELTPDRRIHAMFAAMCV
jgi:glutamine amidotransferase PdxT